MRQAQNIKKMKPCWYVAGLTSTLLILSACSGGSVSMGDMVHLYDEGADKIATDVKTASDKLNLGSMIDAERKNQAAILKYELSVVDDFAASRRDLGLRYLVAAGPTPLSQRLRSSIESRLTEIGGDPDAIIDLVEDVSMDQEDLKRKASEILGLGVKPPACIAGKPITDDMVGKLLKSKRITSRDKAKLTTRISQYRGYCSDLLDHMQQLKVLIAQGSLLHAINADMDDLAKSYSSIKAAKDKADKAYKAAKKKYDAAVKAGKNDAALKLLRKNLADALADLDSVASALVIVANFYGLKGLDDVQNELTDYSMKICTIDALLVVAAEKISKDLASVDKDKDGNKICGKLVKEADLKAQAKTNKILEDYKDLLPLLSDLKNLSQAPLVEALLLEKERFLAKKEIAEKVLKNAAARKNLIEDSQAQLFKEMEMLIEARQYLNWAVNENNDAEIIIDELYHGLKIKVPIDARRHIVAAISSYLNTITGPRRQKHANDYRLLDLRHSEILDQSAPALKLWTAVVKNPIALIQAYHEAGLKSEDIIQLMQSLGLIATGVGVNR